MSKCFYKPLTYMYILRFIGVHWAWLITYSNKRIAMLNGKYGQISAREYIHALLQKVLMWKDLCVWALSNMFLDTGVERDLDGAGIGGWWGGGIGRALLDQPRVKAPDPGGTFRAGTLFSQALPPIYGSGKCCHHHTRNRSNSDFPTPSRR